MSRRTAVNLKSRRATRRDLFVLPRATRNALELGQRARGAETRNERRFLPSEDWHEPSEGPTSGYRIIVHDPGKGYVHVVTPEQIRNRLAQLPRDLLRPLEVIQLSRMTRKKKVFPCYGMQWGNAIYLYPLESSLVEHFQRPPRPSEYNEARMFGGRWVQEAGAWRLTWTQEAIRDFYLNNVLIHELGHLLDNRNSNQRDRERYAEWFAIEHGYRPTRRGNRRSRHRTPSRRERLPNGFRRS